MSNRRDFTKKNPRFSGVESMLVPKGNTGERPTAVEGEIRYNTQLGFLEQYNATGWAGIDAPPTVSSITGTVNEDTDSTITVLGSNFKSGSSVQIEGNAVNNITRNLSTTYINSGELQAATAAGSSGYVGGASFNIKVTNPSGLSAVLEPAGTIDQDPIWTTGAGLVDTVYDTARSGYSFTFVASDPDGTSVTYSLTSGAFPGGATLDTNTGVLSGNLSAVGSDTTYNFDITATSSAQSVARSFSITVKAPVSSSFSPQNGTYSPQSWSKPSGVTSFTVYLWGAGGGSGANGNNTGGAGGYSTATVTTNSASQTFGVFVGQGGFYSDQNGGGGGYSGLFIGTSESAGNCIAIAGGGGGASAIVRSTNGGGATVPDNGGSYGADQSSGDAQPACGGACSSDGSWPFGSVTFSGQQFRGGWGCGGNIRGNGGWPGGGHAGGGNGCNGGAGGAGWYGGGGGGDRGGNSCPGNGGSGYVAGQTSGSGSLGSGVTVTGGSSSRSGSQGTPPQTGNTYYSGSTGYGSGAGGIGTGSRAGGGRIVIVY